MQNCWGIMTSTKGEEIIRLIDLNLKCACVHGDYEKSLMSRAFIHQVARISFTNTTSFLRLQAHANTVNTPTALGSQVMIIKMSNMNPSGIPPWSKNAKRKSNS